MTGRNHGILTLPPQPIAATIPGQMYYNSGHAYLRNASTDVQLLESGSLTTSDIGIPGQLGGSPYITLKDWFQNTRSSGRIAGGVISSHGDGTVDVTQMDGMIFTTDAITGLYIPFRKAASNVSGIIDQATSWLYIDYDAGNLTYRAATDRTVVHEWDQFIFGRVFRKGTVVECMLTGYNIFNSDRIAHDRLIIKYGPMDYVSGAQVSQPTSLHIRIEAATWYCAVYPFATGVVDTSGASTFQVIYKTGATTWNYSSPLHVADTLYYNDINSPYGLVALSNNTFGVYWVAIDPNGDAYLLYGQASYAKQTDAEAASMPITVALLPPELRDWGKIIAKIIFKKGATSFLEIISILGVSSGSGAASAINIQTLRRQVAFGIRSSSAD
jgi:hypothetical protein